MEFSLTVGLQGATSLATVLPAETGPGLRLIVYNILKEKRNVTTANQKVVAQSLLSHGHVQTPRSSSGLKCINA